MDLPFVVLLVASAAAIWLLRQKVNPFAGETSAERETRIKELRDTLIKLSGEIDNAATWREANVIALGGMAITVQNMSDREVARLVPVLLTSLDVKLETLIALQEKQLVQGTKILEFYDEVRELNKAAEEADEDEEFLGLRELMKNSNDPEMN